MRDVRARRQWARVLWSEQPGLHRGYVVDVTVAVLVAVALIGGGRQRTVAVAWRTLNESGGPELWGSVFAAGAALLILATFVSGKAMMVALLVTAVPYGLMGTWFLQGALAEPSASFLGAILCFARAVTHVTRGASYWAGPAS
jgi:hypothetical protein